jgi:hypothetical protein
MRTVHTRAVTSIRVILVSLTGACALLVSAISVAGPQSDQRAPLTSAAQSSKGTQGTPSGSSSKSSPSKKGSSSRSASKSASKSSSKGASARDKAEAAPAPAEKLKSVYVVPFRGQFGTDIHPACYEDILEDLEDKRPDIIIFELDSADIDRVEYMGEDPRNAGLFSVASDDTMMRKMLRDFKDKHSYAQQYVWVKDSVGFGSLLAFSWPDMYMAPDARLFGLSRAAGFWTRVEDPEVRAKFREAAVAIINGFLSSGGYDLKIGEAMLRPEMLLSASYKGRNIEWREDTKGHWVVDGRDDSTAGFSAESAEELGLSKGSAESLDELMFVLGIREFDRVPDDGETLHKKYVEDWRKAYDQCGKLIEESNTAQEDAQNANPKGNLNKAKSALTRVVGLMKKYPPVSVKLQSEGTTLLAVETEILRLNEQIRALSQSQQNQGATGGGSRGNRGFGGGGRGLGR